MALATHSRVIIRVSKPSSTSVPARRSARAWLAVSMLGALSCLSLAVAATTGVGPGAGPAQSLEQIARRAEAVVRQGLPVTVPPRATADVPGGMPRHRVSARLPDPRLRLVACGAPLEAEVPPSSGGLRARSIVQVRCTAASGRWTVLVPVSVDTEADVLVATRGLARGQVPGASDLQVVRQILPGLSNAYISNISELRGYHLARPLAAGQPLVRGALAADPVVRRGEAVTMVASVNGLEVRVPGRALADAGAGELVRVQNLASLKVIEGRADDTGMVRVDR